MHQLTATGGSGARAWALDSGVLPAGLTLEAATGKLMGTPSQTGVFIITVRVTDPTGSAVSEPLRLTISP